jgi:cytochrome c2
MTEYAYPFEVPDVAATASADAGADAQRPNIVPMIAAASLEDGNAGFKKCAACHSVVADAKPMTGPNLHNVVGRAVGGDPNFAKYTDSLKAIGGEWSYDKLDDYLQDPKRLVLCRPEESRRARRGHQVPDGQHRERACAAGSPGGGAGGSGTGRSRARARQLRSSRRDGRRRLH